MMPLEPSAETLVNAYLGDRSLPPMLYHTAVWVTQARLVGGESPALSDFLRRDIDAEAVTRRTAETGGPASVPGDD